MDRKFPKSNMGTFGHLVSFLAGLGTGYVAFGKKQYCDHCHNRLYSPSRFNHIDEETHEHLDSHSEGKTSQSDFQPIAKQIASGE
jgi:hypothetical protein